MFVFPCDVEGVDEYALQMQQDVVKVQAVRHQVYTFDHDNATRAMREVAASNLRKTRSCDATPAVFCFGSNWGITIEWVCGAHE